MSKDRKPEPLPPDQTPDATELSPNLAKIQREAATESEPKLAPLVRQEKTGPDSPPYAPTAGGLPVPRAVHQNERAPQGLRRFRIQCSDPPAPFRYVLAASKEEAIRHYLASTGVTAVLEAISADVRPTPRLQVRELKD